MKPLLHLAGGSRAEFLKLVPLARAALASGRLEHQLIDTGDLDPAATTALLEELGVPQPPVRLAVDVAAGGDRVGQVMIGYRGLCRVVRPDALVVAGSSPAAIACVNAARKLSIPVIQAEAGLRSGVDSPEEAARIEADRLADRHFVGDDLGVLNLVREGVNAGRIHRVGSLVIDNLFHQLAEIQMRAGEGVPGEQVKKVLGTRYGVVAIQHVDNLGNGAAMARIAAALRELSSELPLVFSLAPATRANLERSATSLGANVLMVPRLGSLEFVNLCRNAALILTDNSCLQEESAALGVPCLTLRDATERRATLELGANTLVGSDPARIAATARQMLKLGHRPCRVRDWDGMAAARIATVLADSIAAAA